MLAIWIGRIGIGIRHLIPTVRFDSLSNLIIKSTICSGLVDAIIFGKLWEGSSKPKEYFIPSLRVWLHLDYTD